MPRAIWSTASRSSTAWRASRSAAVRSMRCASGSTATSWPRAALTVADVEAALRAENLELPAGSLESVDRQFSVRIEPRLQRPGRLRPSGACARDRRPSGPPRRRRAGRARHRGRSHLLPRQRRAHGRHRHRQAIDRQHGRRGGRGQGGGRPHQRDPARRHGDQTSFDGSIFVKDAIKEVYKTLGIAIGLVILVIFLFLGSVRATLVPAVTVPVSVIATFTVLLGLGFSINMLTLLALVLAIGLVVDDAIVVLENIHRRMEEYGETPLVAAYRGTRQVGFAVVATTVVLIAVFVPIAFLQGDVGRLFAEFALDHGRGGRLFVLRRAVAVADAGLADAAAVAPNARSLHPRCRPGLSLGSPRLRPCAARSCCASPGSWSSIFVGTLGAARLAVRADPAGIHAEGGSRHLLRHDQRARGRVLSVHERLHGRDRAAPPALHRVRRGDPAAGARAPDLLQHRALQLRHGDHGPERLRQASLRLGHHGRDPREARRSARRQRLPVMRQGFGARIQKPVQFVIGGGTYEELAQWRDTCSTRSKRTIPA